MYFLFALSRHACSKEKEVKFIKVYGRLIYCCINIDVEMCFCLFHISRYMYVKLPWSINFCKTGKVHVQCKTEALVLDPVFWTWTTDELSSCLSYIWCKSNFIMIQLKTISNKFCKNTLMVREEVTLGTLSDLWNIYNIIMAFCVHLLVVFLLPDSDIRH